MLMVLLTLLVDANDVDTASNKDADDGLTWNIAIAVSLGLYIMIVKSLWHCQKENY